MKRNLLLVFALALVVAACGDPAEQASVDPTTTAWVLESGTVDGEALQLLDTHPITLVFDADGNAGGKSACNNYIAAYTISSSSISFGDAGSTMMACVPDEVMTLETTYQAALARVDSFTSDGSQLTLTGDDVELVFVVDESAQS